MEKNVNVPKERDNYLEIVQHKNTELAKKAVEGAEVDPKVIEYLEGLDEKNANSNLQDKMLMSMGKLGKPMYGGEQYSATRNRAGEVSKRRIKNKLARKSRKANR